MRLSEAEARAAAAFLGLGEAAFHRLYLEPGSPPWDIGLSEAGRCRLQKIDGLCLVHPVKPAVCRLWPFLPPLMARESAFLEAGCACPGLAAGSTWAEFKAAGALGRGRVDPGPGR